MRCFLTPCVFFCLTGVLHCAHVYFAYKHYCTRRKHYPCTFHIIICLISLLLDISHIYIISLINIICYICIITLVIM